MTTHNRNSGFTLLELLVVLAIMGALLGLVAPNISFDMDKKALEREGQEFRLALQQAQDEAWLQGSSRVVVVTAKDVNVYDLVEGKWESSETIYRIPDGFESTLHTSSQLLANALKVLAFSSPQGNLVLLSSGEYLPFEWSLSYEGKTLTLSGDGINAIATQ